MATANALIRSSLLFPTVLPKQAELREKIKQAKTEEEKTALYGEIYKLQYQKRLLETVVGIVAGSPELAITQGTLQLAATKMREETLANSRLFKGIKDAKTGDVLRNDSYDSGYFDGVKPTPVATPSLGATEYSMLPDLNKLAAFSV